MTLEDFVNLPTKAISWAQDPPCSGLRLYTSSSFWNWILRICLILNWLKFTKFLFLNFLFIQRVLASILVWNIIYKHFCLFVRNLFNQIRANIQSSLFLFEAAIFNDLRYIFVAIMKFLMLVCFFRIEKWMALLKILILEKCIVLSKASV